MEQDTSNLFEGLLIDLDEAQYGFHNFHRKELTYCLINIS